MSSSDDFLDRAEGTTPGEAVSQGLAGIVLAIAGGIIAVLTAFFQGLGRVFDVFAAFRDFIVAFFQEPIVILSSSAQATAAWLVGSDLGPFTFAVGVAAIALGFVVWTTIDPDIPFIDSLLPWR